MALSYPKAAGLLLFVGGAQWILANILAEALYPCYSIANNWISDLGVGPSAAIFNASMVLLGLFVLCAAFSLYRSLNSRLFTAVLALTGVGAVGVGIFNENFVNPHSVAALTTFIFSGVSAIFSRRFLKSPFSYVSVILGAIVLAALGLTLSQVFLGIGNGGMERMVTYPAVLWMIGFGGYLMAEETKY